MEEEKLKLLQDETVDTESRRLNPKRFVFGIVPNAIQLDELLEAKNTIIKIIQSEVTCHGTKRGDSFLDLENKLKEAVEMIDSRILSIEKSTYESVERHVEDWIKVLEDIKSNKPQK